MHNETDTAPEMTEETAADETRLHIQDARIILLIGLANGFIIGGFFLIYIVLAVVFGEQTTFAPHA